jgi:hypothetical protein
MALTQIICMDLSRSRRQDLPPHCQMSNNQRVCRRDNVIHEPGQARALGICAVVQGHYFEARIGADVRALCGKEGLACI